MIGEKRVAQILEQVHPGVPSSNPLTAAKAAFSALKVGSIGLLTPYTPDVTRAMQRNFVDSGFEIPLVGSFYEDNDLNVGKISEESILDAAISIGKNSQCSGVFISCTSLRSARVIEKAEVAIGKPVTASNHALAWHLLRLAGIKSQLEGYGTLLSEC
jgi:maleate isomerase